MSEPLAPADAAWLRMDRPGSPMVVHGFFEFAGPLSVDVLHSVLEDRLLTERRFRQRVIEHRMPLRRPAWHSVDMLDMDAHVREVTLDDPDVFRAVVDEIVSAPMDFDRPLWRVTLIHGAGRGSAVVFSIHHAVADGMALLRVLLELCDGSQTPSAGTTASRSSLARLATSAGRIRQLARPDNLLLAPLAATSSALSLLRLALLARAPATHLTLPLGGVKRTAWTRPFALADVKAAAKGLGVTINDVMTAAVTGALGTYLDHHDELDPDVVLRAMVPVNMRPLDEPPSMGNYFGLVLPSLPVAERDPHERLARVKHEMDRIKASPEPAVTFGILRTIGVATSTIHRLVVDFFAHKSSAVLTNVPGPRSTLSFAGVPIDSMMFWVPQAGGLGLGISILSYAGSIGVGVISDAELVPDPGVITDEIERELEVLGC